METKLKELTERIYEEGILKARREGEEIVEQARQEAALRLDEAAKEATQILDQARRQADEIRKNITAEVGLTTHQALGALRQQIMNLITLKMIDQPVKKVFQESDFIRNLIEVLVKNWPASDKSQGLQVMLSEKYLKEVNDYFTLRQHELLDGGLEITGDENLPTGFRIGPRDGNYRISFTDEDFAGFIKAYLRPRTQQMLFGDNQ
ncbi:MAG: hypothetical protein PHD61_12490 [Bacteroidales bacterium]|nr:hypothetical protein [Lentimicrobiaceae bacterium]MDD5696107.1 hypothetical protein [Bacteroidales bacterium]